jgi:sec-independent protein translocase protein TatA
MSFTHILILGLVILVLSGGNRLPKAARGIGEGIRNFKKGLRGESDIDITDSAKRLDDKD